MYKYGGVMKRTIRIIVGVTVGAIAGFLYYRFIGCNSGACPITSNPLNTTLYGGLMGILFAV